MTIFDDIRKDREAGTEDCSAIVMAKPIQDFSWDEIDADARRIARVPRLERIALAGAELHDRVMKAQNGWPHKPGWVEEAAAAFRAACGEGK